MELYPQEIRQHGFEGQAVKYFMECIWQTLTWLWQLALSQPCFHQMGRERFFDRWSSPTKETPEQQTVRSLGVKSTPP